MLYMTALIVAKSQDNFTHNECVTNLSSAVKHLLLVLYGS